ncbi:hypothetical protein CAY60_019015 [Shouchella clausii]|jgi:hypothetical protein|nr:MULTISPECIES: hypothetical protein [Shouchella]ALA52544.1 hypothetical protein DB29_01716 [Shouchella clausii]MDO7268819.1 hypothetical protein [Shouchella clausii]MDO7283618.1 hypothetical protein [Shouchella clausii]MDO7288966.1 hypothetical protein [Shouchella clausii]MDO7303714.1 hypothetical protein [Shouchella clausii]
MKKLLVASLMAFAFVATVSLSHAQAETVEIESKEKVEIGG